MNLNPNLDGIYFEAKSQFFQFKIREFVVILTIMFANSQLPAALNLFYEKLVSVIFFILLVKISSYGN